jgi:hypothetical protein
MAKLRNIVKPYQTGFCCFELVFDYTHCKFLLNQCKNGALECNLKFFFQIFGVPTNYFDSKCAASQKRLRTTGLGVFNNSFSK